MRTHGWAGELPRDEQQARDRIVSAARRLMGSGDAPGIADVARAVGVSRQTVYRYYRTTEELLDAAALDAVGELLDRLSAHVEQFLHDPRVDHADAMVEVVLWVYVHLHDDLVMVRLVSPGRLSTSVRGLTAASSVSLGRTLLDEMPIDWAALGLGVPERADLVEHLLRMLQSLVLDPGDRTLDEQRAYLGRWLAPAVRALGADAVSSA
ncbi:MAG TPA: TetR/AcrR family transcriptional regulator [Mycobacteriales bacterium]|nr:TetR/AcrR family transcriptional regulator [Mycobacteriales bacterium]